MGGRTAGWRPAPSAASSFGRPRPRASTAPPPYTPATPAYLGPYADNPGVCPIAEPGGKPEDRLDERLGRRPGAPVDDSLLASRLDDSLRASVAARRDAAAALPAPRRDSAEPARGARGATAGERPSADADGSPVSATREAADRAAEVSDAAATTAGSEADEPEAAVAKAEPRRLAWSNNAQRAEGQHGGEILLRLARPPLLPETGGSSLARESFAIDLRQRPFQAPRTMQLPAEQRPATGRDGRPVPDAGTSPAAAALAFGAAVGTSQAFYDRLVGAARQVAADAVRENLRAGDRARDALDRELAALGGLLDTSRTTLDRARDFAIEKVEALDKRLRRQINGAAASAFGRLARMRRTYDARMSGPRGERTRIETDLSTALSETNAKALEAHAALQTFATAPAEQLTTADFNSEGAGGDIVARAKLEAALQFIVPYINADDRAMAERLTAIEGMLKPLHECLPCQMDSAFQLLDMRMDHLSVAGPKAVAATRDGALRSVNDMVSRLSLSIHDTHATVARQLVIQHDRTRRELVTQARLHGEGEREDIRTMATRQSDTLTAIAEGQSRGVVEAQRRLSLQKGGDYAGMLRSGASRLRANVAGMERRYPAEQLAVGAAKTAARERQRGAMEKAQGTALAGFDASMAQMIQSTFHDLNANTAKQFLEMADTPGRVRSSCEGFLGPAEEARNNEVAALNGQVAKISTSVAAAINGTSAGGGNTDRNASESNPEAMVCEAEPNMSVAPPDMSSASSPARASTAPAGRGNAQPMPPPASCGACPAASESTASAGPATGTATTPGAGAEGTGQGATTVDAPNASAGRGGNYMSSVDFRAYCDTVTGNPKRADGTAEFITRANSTVQRALENRVGGAHTALDHWRGADGPALMTALRNLTEASGAAVAALYQMSHGDLVSDINESFNDALRYQFADPKTIEWNRQAALDALAGDVTNSTMNELRASFNWSNEDARIRTIMGGLTPAQMAALPASDLDELASQLDGEDRARFDAMRERHSGGADRAVALREAIDSANRSEGAARGRALQAAIATAYDARELTIEGPADRTMGDIFGLEHPAEVEGRRAARWRSTLTAFSGLDNVTRALDRHPDTPVSALSGGTTSPAAPPATAPPRGPATATDAPGEAPAPADAAATPEVDPNRALEDALIRYATRDILHPPPPRAGSAARQDMDFDTRAPRTDHVAPDMLNWIEQSVRHGPNSIQARGAQLLVEYNRPAAHNSEQRLDTVLHIGSGDAREGGGYRPRSTEDADRERDRIFDQFERFRMGLAGEEFIGPIDVNGVRASVRDRFANALPPDSPRQRLALGIIDSEHGNVDAAIDYAIATENTEMALRYLRRMDRRQVDALVARWNEAHPNGPGLYERLGVFSHHWSLQNMNGAVFSGDEANELELALMGVPQNDLERGEVALRTMNQQVEQSTRLGRLLAGSEYDRLKANRSSLLRLMGHRGGDFDSTGRLRATDPVTGEAMRLGNFDRQGNLVPARGSSYSAFERAIALSRITADNFTRAVDAAASFFVTVLVVAAAVITTALTGGAAASIWIPMLVTAAAGLAGVAMTAAIKGGRYSRDEMVRDLIMVAVQTVTAGIGSAGSIAARGGMPALRAVASRGVSQGFRISEKALERFVASKGGTLAASASFGAELGIGATSGALSGGVTAALDPANRRSEDYGDRIWGGMFRGAAGSMVGAGAARGMSAGFGAAGNRIAGAAASRSAALAIATGMPRQQALARAMLAAQRAQWLAGGVTRAISSGASGSTARMAELALEGKAGWDQILAEGRTAFVQNMLQGALEHGADPGQRNPYHRGDPITDSDLHSMPSWQRREHEQTRAMAEAAVSRAYDVPDTGRVTVTPHPGEDGQELSIRRSPLADETETPGSFVRPSEGEAAEPRIRLRSVGGSDDDIADSAEITRKIRPITLEDHLASTDPRPSPFSDRVDLTIDMLRGKPSIPENSIFRATNDRDPAAARRNYEALLANDPNREVLIARNVATGEYMVRQGGSHSIEPPPAGWVTERHSHPRLVSDNVADQLARAMPSATDGDFVVLKAELDRLAVTVPAGTPVRRDSVIDININGQRSETHFSMSKVGEQYSITVTFRPAIGGQETLGPFRSIAAYEARALQLTGIDFSRPTDKSVRTVPGSEAAAPSRVVRNATLAETERNDALFIGKRMAQAEGFAGQARRTVPRGELDPIIARSAAISDAHDRVRAMGLVGQPDSLQKLTRLLNSSDPALTPEMRSALARATLEATRIDLIRSGNLAPGDELLMLFRGVQGPRTDEYEKRGIDLSRLDSGRDEDAGRGLYGSQDFQSARNYAGTDGRGVVLPLIVRQSELGRVIDVRSGTPLGDRWLAHIRATAGEGRLMPSHPHLRGALDPRFDIPMGLGRAGRGARFAEFLASLAADPSLPPAIREAARDPHITLMDLGGVASWGTDRNMLTDQFAMHHQRIADLFNQAHGFPLPGRDEAAVGAEGGAKMRSVSAPPKPGSPSDPDEIAAMARSHPEIAEINRMQARLATADPDGPQALIARNKADDDAGFDAQEQLDDLSRAPRNAHVVDISDADIASLFPPPDGKHQERVVSIGGMRLRLYRSAPTTETPKPAIRYEASVPPTRRGERPKVYQFGSGELRVWRTAPTSEHPIGNIVQESIVGPRRDRQGYENQITSHGEGGYAGAALERGHLHGAGLGLESPFGIGLVPREVNQILQNRGIEGWMRKLRDALPPGATLIYSTEVKWQPGTMRHARIDYGVDIVMGGQRHPYAEFGIDISGDAPGTRRGDRQGTRSATVDSLKWRYSPTDRALNRYFDHLHEIVDLPQVLLFGLRRRAPAHGEAVKALAAHKPEEVEKAIAASAPWELEGVRRQSRSTFRIGTFRDEMADMLARDPSPRLIVVDTRGWNLTEYQLRKIDEALARLSPDQRARIIRLVDAP